MNYKFLFLTSIFTLYFTVPSQTQATTCEDKIEELEQTKDLSADYKHKINIDEMYEALKSNCEGKSIHNLCCNQNESREDLKDRLLELKQTLKKHKQDQEVCKKSVQEMNESLTKFNKSCGVFSGKKQNQCIRLIESCDKCINEDNFEEYDCVSIHKKTKCTVLAGEELKEAKVKRDKLEEEKKELKEQIEKIEKDFITKELDLNEALKEIDKEFQENKVNLEMDTEEEKQQFEKKLKIAKIKIEEKTQAHIAHIQKVLNKKLQITHNYENTLYAINKKYRDTKRKLRKSCEIEALAKLAEYKEKRRKAIQTGSLKISLSSIVKKGYVSFAKKDARRFKVYKERCSKNMTEEFKEIDLDYKQEIKMFEQKKAQTIADLEQMKKQIHVLNQSESNQKNQALKEYKQNMKKVIEKYNKRNNLILSNYMKQKKHINNKTKEIQVLAVQKERKVQELQNKKNTWIRETELIKYLKNKEVSSKTNQDSFGELLADFTDYEGKVQSAKEECRCSEEENLKNNSCKSIFKQNKNIDSESDSSTTKGRTREKNGNR